MLLLQHFPFYVCSLCIVLWACRRPPKTVFKMLVIIQYLDGWTFRWIGWSEIEVDWKINLSCLLNFQKNTIRQRNVRVLQFSYVASLYVSFVFYNCIKFYGWLYKVLDFMNADFDWKPNEVKCIERLSPGVLRLRRQVAMAQISIICINPR